MQEREVKPLAEGVVVGGAYRVLRPLADGGMGIIYEVQELATGSRRALEVLDVAMDGDDELADRLVRETRLAGYIPSEHVARVLDAGRDPALGALYVVTEPLEGSTLASVLFHSGALAWSAARAVLEQVAHALAAAHARGLLHRDLQPSNVFLARSEHESLPFTVKVLGFGVAKALAAAREPGTPAWLAPEQLTPGATVRAQADVWTFGVLAFALLTGKHYFSSANVAASPASAVMREVLVDALAPASRRAAELGVADRLPAGFDGWFARCVHRDPGRRFPDIREAYDELARLSPPGSVGFEHEERTAVSSPRARSQAAAAEASAQSHPPTEVLPPPPAPAAPGWAGAALAGVAAVVGASIALAFVLHARGSTQASAAAAAAASGAAPTPGVALRLHGSNTIGAELAPALAEGFLRRRTGLETIVQRRTGPDEIVVEARDGARTVDAVEIAAHGSATAFEDLAAGRCDVGMASRRIHDDEAAKLSGFGDLTSAAAEHVIALDGIAVIVNPVNPVASLTKQQIGDIFAGRLTRWSDVYWKPDLIVVHARDDRSGTFDTFRHLVLEGRGLAADARRHESSEELSDAVAADPRAIGFIGLPYVRSAKPIMVQEEGSAPLLPSPLTVSTEDYPLTRRLYLYAPLGASTVTRDFVDFAQSEDGQKIVDAAGFVDLRPECDPNASRCTSCTAEYRRLVAGACRLSLDFRFVRGGAQLDTRGLRDLQRVTAMMSSPDYRGRTVVLLGFADASGARADNVALSEQRAAAVATQLRARGLHVDVERGLGPDMPVSDNATEEGRERNRRVEVWLR